MNRTYYITLETDIYLDSLKVEVTINDPDEYDYTIESIYYNEWDVTHKLDKYSKEIENLIDECINEDENLTAEYNQSLIDRKEDSEFREKYEG